MPTDAPTCACPDCPCTVADAVSDPYCSEACANGHKAGDGCGHAGCACHG